MPFPPLPTERSNPWFDQRQNWDLAVQNDLEVRLSDANIASKITTGSVQFSIEGTPLSAIAGTAFSTVIINATPSINIGGGTYSTGNGLYTVPADGMYLVTCQIRINDSSSARQVGLAYHTTNADGSWVLWEAMPQGYLRSAKQYTRLLRMTTGQQGRMFIYSDGSNFNCSGAQINLIRLAA